MQFQARKYSWLYARLWLALIAYWLICMVGTGIIARSAASSPESGFVVFVMLAFVIVCMATERGQWKSWQRVGFVFLAWIAHALLSIPVLFLVGSFMRDLSLLNRAVAFIASIPAIIFGMRHSKLFVRLEDPGMGAQQVTAADESSGPR